MGAKCDENESFDPNARFGPGATAELNSGNTGTSKLSAQHSKHAQNLWSMLDDMAENDPEGYKAFLEKQAREAVHSVPKSSLNTLNTCSPRASFILHAAITHPSSVEPISIRSNLITSSMSPKFTHELVTYACVYTSVALGLN